MYFPYSLKVVHKQHLKEFHLVLHYEDHPAQTTWMKAGLLWKVTSQCDLILNS